MTAVPASRRRIALGAAALCAALLTSACAAGQHAQTAQSTPGIDGITATLRNIKLVAASVAAPAQGSSYAAGSDAPLRLAIVSTGQQDDALLSVTATVAGGAQVQAAGSSASGSGSESTSAAPSAPTYSSSPASGGTTTSTTASTSATASASPTTSASAFAPITVPAGGRVSFGLADGDGTLLLTGLTAAVYPGSAVRVTFTFRTAGTITLMVPVQLTASPVSGLVVSGSATQSE